MRNMGKKGRFHKRTKSAYFRLLARTRTINDFSYTGY